MSDPIRDAAIEAAARVNYEAWRFACPWGDLSDETRQKWAKNVAPEVDAVLAVAGPAYRAEALRDAAENDDPEFHIEVALGGGDYVHHWLRDRAYAEEQS